MSAKRQEVKAELDRCQAVYDEAAAEIERLTAAEATALDEYMAANNRVGLDAPPSSPAIQAAQKKREALDTAREELAAARRGLAPLAQALDAAKQAYQAAGGTLTHNPSKMVSPLEIP